MGKVITPNPVKLIVGMISNQAYLFEEGKLQLAKEFGSIDYESDLLPFNKTKYYEEEMGRDLKRKFLSFKELILPHKLVQIKLFTNRIEKEFMDNIRRRRINIDPGYLNAGKLILATTKDWQHRLYLGEGIYGEVTLRFKQGSFCVWEWTYPDYRTSCYIETFNHIRKLYMEQINVDRIIQ